MDTHDTSPSILLFFDKQRFILNAGEGLQRFCTEHKVKLSKIDHIFLSRVCSETAGGLPGLLLTLAGIGDHGMCVHPSDVMDPSIPGPIVLLVDCPTISHLLYLLSVGSLNMYYTDLSSYKLNREVNCIVHLTPSSVANSLDYQRWMKRFGNAQHIMAGHDTKMVQVPVLQSSAGIAACLNYLCPQFFPAPGFWSLHNITDSSKTNSLLEASQGFIFAKNLLKFNLRPYANMGLDESSIPGLITATEIVDKMLSEHPDIADAAQQIRQLSDHFEEVNGSDVSSSHDGRTTEEPWFNDTGLPSCLENISREDMEIVLLGTGSSQPSKYWNVSSIHIDLFSKGSLLFDCGEGTLGQLRRRYGVDGADNAVRGLRCIWISHIHADHHTGLTRILALRRDLLRDIPHEPLLVVGPEQLMWFLNAYQRLEELDMQFLDCMYTTKFYWNAFKGSANSCIDHSCPMESNLKRPCSPAGEEVTLQRSNINYLKEVLQDAGLVTLVSFPVVHCSKAFGVALEAARKISRDGKERPGWKIVYSGDTRPCPELIEASRGATALIHEATFEEGMVHEAVAKRHSTTKEAIEAAGVYRIILTLSANDIPRFRCLTSPTCIIHALVST